MIRIDRIKNILTDPVNDAEYIYSSKFPISEECISDLLDIETTNRLLLSSIYIEFSELSLSAKHTFNLLNNLDCNLMLPNLEDSIVKDMLIQYTETNIRKTLYPITQIVDISVMLLYSKIIADIDIFEDYEASIISIYDNFVKKQFPDINYSNEFIIKWVYFYVNHLLINHKEFIENLKQHCFYLLNTWLLANEKYKNKVRSYNSNIHCSTTSINLNIGKSLAWAMSNIFNINSFATLCHEEQYAMNYNYLENNNLDKIYLLLNPLFRFIFLSIDYIETADKPSINIPDLSILTKQEIINLLETKKRIITKNPTSEYYLFPLDIVYDETKTS